MVALHFHIIKMTCDHSIMLPFIVWLTDHLLQLKPQRTQAAVYGRVTLRRLDRRSPLLFHRRGIPIPLKLSLLSFLTTKCFCLRVAIWTQKS